LNIPSTSSWVPLATLLRPQGRRGELLSEPLSDLPDIFSTGQQLALVAAGTLSPALDGPSIVIEDHWFPTGKNAGRIVLKLSGCDTISQAEALAGHQLLIPSADLPTLDADTFFVGDLVGCTLFDGTAAVGTVTDLEFATGPDGRTRLEDAAPLLAVQLTAHEEEEPVLVPFIRAWLDAVDIPGRRIVMHLPEGLLDSE
jgi:16S rRNA processing protein RimM